MPCPSAVLLCLILGQSRMPDHRALVLELHAPPPLGTTMPRQHPARGRDDRLLLGAPALSLSVTVNLHLDGTCGWPRGLASQPWGAWGRRCDPNVQRHARRDVQLLVDTIVAPILGYLGGWMRLQARRRSYGKDLQNWRRRC